MGDKTQSGDGKAAAGRIAILAFYYPVAYSPTILNTAFYWASRRYNVDILLDRVVFAAVEKQHPNINIVYCTSLPSFIKFPVTEQKSVIQSLLSIFPGITVYGSLYNTIVSGWLLPIRQYARGIKRQAKGKSYNFLIAFEPEALIAAYWSGLTKTNKFYYHSLELYEPGSFKNCLKLKLEKKALHNALFVVAQDEQRIAALRKGLNNAKITFIESPVSMIGPGIEKKNDYLYRKYSIPLTKRIILYTGAFSEVNYTEEIAAITNSPGWNADWILVMHGFCASDEFISTSMKKAAPGKLIFSLDNLSQAELDDLVSSADIGIGLYKQKDENNALVILSSGKIAQYAKCGLPLIVSSNPPTDAFLKQYQFGRSIKDVSELCENIKSIFNDYEYYRNNMLQTFILKYEFMSNYERIAEALNIL